MNKFFKLLLLFTFIIAIGLFYKNHLKKARINVSDCPNNRWFYTKRKLFGIAFGIDKEAKIKYISVPEKEKKNILKNIDKYPEKNIENRCVLVEVLKGNY